MRRLFWKIFLYFLLIILLVSSAVILLTYFRDQEFPPLANQSFAQQAIAEYGRKATDAYESQGIIAVDAFSRKILRNSGIRLILFDAAGHPLSQQRIPRYMEHLVRRAKQSGEVVMPMMGRRNGLASVVYSTSGKTYFVAIGLPERPQSKHLFQGLIHGFLGWQLLLLLAVTAVVCYFLARSLTAPISQLRQATRKFAAGDLSIRLGNQIKGRNELAGLAHDFDNMAGEIESLIGRQKNLLRDISHELRSPLTRLGIALELVRQAESSPVRDKALQRIELEAERMNTMIGQLLNLTRLESGHREVPQQNFDLRVLLDQLVADANYEAETQQCKVVLSAPEAVPFHGSQELLAQALENIIRNGLKYTAENSVVAVTLSVTAATLLLTITDQGPGVPEESLGKLFEPFYRVAAARDRQTGGTGIGLAIAERAIKLHSGTIVAKNRPEGGLLIEITLPIAA